MKVVIFCGGLGLRMRSEIDSAPKPMMMIGDRPVLWHVMRYYAHFGHTEFILCLGYGAASVKEYFLNYEETSSNDFVLSKGGQNVELLQSDISEWRISFVDTGIDTAIGERLPPGPALSRGRRDLPGQLRRRAHRRADGPHRCDFIASDATASLLAVPPQASFHVVDVGEGDRVSQIHPASDLSVWVNGGYFVLRQGVFDVLGPGEDLVTDAFARLADQGKLAAVRYQGFWAPMDTLKERSALEELHRHGRPPWQVWAPQALVSRP